MASSALRRGCSVLPAWLAAACQSASTQGRLFAASNLPQSFSRQQRPTFHSAPFSLSLRSILEAEIQHEKESDESNGDKPASALDSVPMDWTLTESPASTAMTLTKSADGETVRVQVNVSDQEEAVPEEDPESGETQVMYPIRYTVEIVKGAKMLQFFCLFMEDDEDGPQIDHVALVPAAKADDTAEKYSGPDFGELDDGLQDEFMNYLRGKGIDADFSQYICQLVHDKENKDYVAWLQDVKKFVA